MNCSLCETYGQYYCPEHYPKPVQKKKFSQERRDELASEGKALPDGSYPIENEQDLRNAIQAIGRAKDPAAARRHIIKRARALDLTNLLPDDWKVQKSLGVVRSLQAGLRGTFGAED